MLNLKELSVSNVPHSGLHQTNFKPGDPANESQLPTNFLESRERTVSSVFASLRDKCVSTWKGITTSDHAQLENPTS